MNYFKVLLPILTVVLIGCKTENKQERQPVQKETTLLEKMAHASGYDNWKNVEELKFTFNVDRDTSHFERTWIWQVGKNQVTLISKTDSLTYNRGKMDSIATKANGGFINDKYWLMAPFNLVWDNGNFTHTHTLNEMAPISKKPMQKLTIVYGNEGGYTPGDAYDLYFEDDYLIQEWVFRKANQPEASLTTTWENYIEKDGLKIAQSHKNDEGFNLYFTDITVKTR